MKKHECECLVVRWLWLELFEWYQLATDINVSPEKDVIILNEGYTPIVSSLILMTKSYIFICRCKEMAPSLVGLLKYVKKEITLECEADIRANQKWEPIIELLWGKEKKWFVFFVFKKLPIWHQQRTADIGWEGNMGKERGEGLNRNNRGWD